MQSSRKTSRQPAMTSAGVVIAAASGQPLAEANPFFAATPPSPAFLAWAVAWVVLVMLVAAFSLRRREL